MLRSCPGGQVCSVGKRKVAPRKSPNCNNALDNFDVISVCAVYDVVFSRSMSNETSIIC